MPNPPSMQIYDHRDAYLDHLTHERHLAVRTVSGYRHELDLLLRRVTVLERAALADFITTGENGQPLAPATRNRRLVAVRGFLRYLRDRGHLADDPSAGIVRARVPNDRRVALGVAELTRALAIVRADRNARRAARDEAIFVLLFQTGLRVSELVGLTVDQVDLASAVLRGVARKGGSQVDVLLNPDARRALRAWVQVHPNAENRALFSSGRGAGGLTVRAVQKRLRAIGLAAALVVPLHPHRLRHAHATALLRVGSPVEVIRQSLHHSSIATTQRYLHGDDALLRDALDRMPRLTAGTHDEDPSGKRSSNPKNEDP